MRRSEVISCGVMIGGTLGYIGAGCVSFMSLFGWIVRRKEREISEAIAAG